MEMAPSGTGISVMRSKTTGQPCVKLQHESGATAEVQLHGATITSYKSAAGKELLFLSEKAIYDGKKAIRGGIPIVFPQFGQPDKSLPSHGFARVAEWCMEKLDHEYIILTLTDKPEFMRELPHLQSDYIKRTWPHSFKLFYEIRLTATQLKCTLSVRNIGTEPYQCQALLHTYLSVPDVSAVAVHGLSGLRCIDKVAAAAADTSGSSSAPNSSGADDAAIGINQEVDSIYMNADNDVTLTAGDVNVTVEKSAVMIDAAGSSTPVPVDVVLWNPWEAKSLTMSDLPVGGYKQFVCIEPGLVSQQHTVEPSCTLQLTQIIKPQ